MKAAFAVWNRAFPNMVMDPIWMYGVMWGLLSSCAIGAASMYVIIVRIVPIVNSKVIAAFRISLIFVCLFWWLYWAVYFIVAWSIPMSRMSMSRFGTVRVIPTRPYWPSSRIPATIMTPIADMMEDAATPQNRLNPPLAEVFANFTASLRGILPYRF